MPLLQWQSDCMHRSLEEVSCWELGEHFNTDLGRTFRAAQVRASNQDCEHGLGE